ncbi:MAG: phosphoglycerate kinase [bacterium]|nr:phosphoglycerate kinase [bacterium]
MKFLKDLTKKNLTGKICLLRVDFNVESMKDSLRMEASLPTMKWLLAKGARLVVLSHRGRPGISSKHQVVSSKYFDPELSLRGVLPFLRKNLREQVIYLNDIPDKLPDGNIFLLENLRFWPEEEKDDAGFAKRLAKIGDFYVNDAFAVSHRKNSSVTQLPKLLPSYAGLLLEKEITTLAAVMKKPKKPLVLIFGGAKVEDKLPVIRNLLPKADKVLLGSSIFNYQYFTLLIRNKKIIKPIDWAKKDDLALDIGPLTAKLFIKEIKKAKTIIWNGPVGKFEDKKYLAGSRAVAKAIAASKAFSIVGGGETTTVFQRAIPNFQLLISDKKLFLSTGGGAMLEFLAGVKLPGISALG